MPAKKSDPRAQDPKGASATPALGSPGGGGIATRRRAAVGGSKGDITGVPPTVLPTPAAVDSEGGGSEAAGGQPSKKRKKLDRLQENPGSTSAAALAAAAAAAAEEELAGPVSPRMTAADAPDGMDVDGEAGRMRDNEVLMEAVVKVFCVHSEPNFSLPWQRKRQYSSSGSGFITQGRRILTNAHCVDHNTQVKVKRRGSDAKFVAQVLAVGTECDIAMLTVEDESFWEGLEPVHFGTLPRLQDSVTVIGYPIGGDTMSVTSGVVSRIEVTPYVHGTSELLGIQVDAAINSGNSGGPAFNRRGECVGIAFQSLKSEDTENISYIIPTPVINHFITDYERNGKYTGFPALGVEWQKMESPVLRSALGMKVRGVGYLFRGVRVSDPGKQGISAPSVKWQKMESPVLRSALGMKPRQRGVLIRRVEPTSAASAVLKQGDILLAFDRVEIGNDGTVPFRSGERIGFSYLISQKYTGDTAQLSLLRGGEPLEVTVSLKGARRLIPVHINNRPPSYFIVAGLVFTPVTVPFLKSEYGKDFDFDSPVKLLDKMLHAMAENESQQVVVLSQVLASDVNVGYEEIVNTQVTEVNGSKVNNLRDLVKAVESAPGPYIRFDLDYNQVVILEKATARSATPDILAMHCIPSDRSQDLLEANGAAPGAAAAAGADGTAAGATTPEGGEQQAEQQQGQLGARKRKQGEEEDGQEEERKAADADVAGAGSRGGGEPSPLITGV
ncbi:hypothetical protein N2152v2_002951 [Parachlorella kessleri]